MDVNVLFDSLAVLAAEVEYNTVKSEHENYEIEKVPFDAFVHHFRTKDEWAVHINDKNSVFNTILGLDNHFLVIDSIDSKNKKVSERVSIAP